MRWLRKLLGREKSHEQWLEEHPGKSSEKYVEVEVNQEERDSIRAQMEQDLEQQREQREAQ